MAVSFDTISHEWLKKFIEHRIGDKRLVALIEKWLRAGVMEEDTWQASEMGTPQGGLVSPILANIYLTMCLTCGPTTGGSGAREER
jgi:RNA-directed DNA polymerase